MSGYPLSGFAASSWKGDDSIAAGRPLLGVSHFWGVPVSCHGSLR